MKGHVSAAFLITAVMIASCTNSGGENSALDTLLSPYKEHIAKLESRGTGLTRSSFGPLSTRTTPCFIDNCQKDGQDPRYQCVARNVLEDVLGPLADLVGSHSDETLAKLDLERNFKIVRGENYPYVRVIDRKDSEYIDFWAEGYVVKTWSEFDNSAAQYCKRSDRIAQFDGYAFRCGKTHLAPFTINKQRKYYTDVDLIVAYSCVNILPAKKDRRGH